MQTNAQWQVERICGWLSQNVRQLGAKGAVVRVSADLNCAITAKLAKTALGANARGLILPCHSSSEQTDAAQALAGELDLPCEVIDLTEAYDRLQDLIPPLSQEARTSLMSRLRMLTLYQYATARDCAVLGAISRSEWETGKFVRYGDSAADLYPIIHLLKSELLALADYFQLPASIVGDSARRAALEPAEQQLDAYFHGERLDLAESDPLNREELFRTSLQRKYIPFQLSLLEGAWGKEVSSSETQETYDRSIEALTLISKAITSDQYLEDILRLIVMVTAEVMNSSVCSLWLLDEKEGVMRLRATQSIDSEYLKDRVLMVGEGVVGKVVAENRPYIVSNVLTDPYYKEKELARRMGLVSMLSVPMRVKERVIGVINCYTSHPHAFSDLQMNVLTTVANQAAVAIEKTELMVQTKVIQEELEKRKLIERAKDLLMKRFHLSGEEAYRWLQKRSMNTRKSMREVAEAVILTMEG